MDILTLASLCQLAAHLLVQGSHHRVAGVIFQIRAVAHRDGCSLGITDTQDKHVDALLVGHLRCLLRTLFVVFAIGNHDDGPAHVVLLGEALGGEADGLSDVGALGLDETRGNVLQEHLGRNVVASDRQLHEGIACEDDETNLVVGEVINQILYQHLALVET